MSIVKAIKKAIPARLLNRVILAAPALYRLPFVNYESNLDRGGGVDELLRLVEETARLPGDIVECGSSRAGSAILMARRLRGLGATKTVIAIDSFAGFDLDELERERRQGRIGAGIADTAFTSTNFEYVAKKVAALGFEGTIAIRKGYFQDVLPTLDPANRYSLAFIDCDLEASMTYCADFLWPKLVPGGIVAFDDYRADDFKGAKRAVDAFVSRAADIASHEMGKRLYVVRKNPHRQRN